jgi:hypothetical protein
MTSAANVTPRVGVAFGECLTSLTDQGLSIYDLIGPGYWVTAISLRTPTKITIAAKRSEKKLHQLMNLLALFDSSKSLLFRIMM